MTTMFRASQDVTFELPSGERTVTVSAPGLTDQLMLTAQWPTEMDDVPADPDETSPEDVTPATVEFLNRLVLTVTDLSLTELDQFTPEQYERLCGVICAVFDESASLGDDSSGTASGEPLLAQTASVTDARVAETVVYSDGTGDSEVTDADDSEVTDADDSEVTDADDSEVTETVVKTETEAETATDNADSDQDDSTE